MSIIGISGITEMLNEAFRGSVKFETTLAKMQEAEQTLIESCIKMHTGREVLTSDIKRTVVEATGNKSFIRYNGEVIGELVFQWPTPPHYDGSVTLNKY